jgi:hypothetical protein
MSAITKLGLIFLLAGILVLGYQSISTLMGADRTANDLVWKKLSLADVFGGIDEASFENFSFFGMRDIFKFLGEAPLFLWMFGLAFLCFLMHAFSPK